MSEKTAKLPEQEVYCEGYAAGAATVLRKIPWPKAPEGETRGRWLNGFEHGQQAALHVLKLLRARHEERERNWAPGGLLDFPEFVRVFSLFRMVDRYIKEHEE